MGRDGLPLKVVVSAALARSTCRPSKEKVKGETQSPLIGLNGLEVSREADLGSRPWSGRMEALVRKNSTT